MNKTLKFQPQLADEVLRGDKTSTWRLFDDKDLQTDDIVDLLVFGSEEKFGTAKLTEVTEKNFEDLNEDDWVGHEKYVSDEDMYQVFTDMYGQQVNGKTKVKIVRFALL